MSAVQPHIQPIKIKTVPWNDRCVFFAGIVDRLGHIPVAGQKFDDGAGTQWDAGLWFCTQKSEKKVDRLAALRIAHPLIDAELGRYLTQKKRTIAASWEDQCVRYAAIVDKIQGIPVVGQKVVDSHGVAWDAGVWFRTQKAEKIPERMEVLRRAHPIIEKELDRFLQTETRSNVTSWDTQCRRYVDLVIRLGHLPIARQKYDGWNAYSWLSSQKKNNRAERLDILRAQHPLIAAELGGAR